MTRDERSRREALQDAIQFETDGRAFFLEAARKTSDYFGRIIFNSLADEELGHIERIRDIDRSLSDTGRWPGSDTPVRPEGKNVFEEARMQIDETVRDRTDDLHAVKLAIDLERKGVHFYSSLAAKANEPREKEFYERLAAEEQRHLQILEDTWRVLMEQGSSTIE